METKRIYVIVAATIQVPVTPGTFAGPFRTVEQPRGRQIAQACHVVSKLRIEMHDLSSKEGFEPITTIILQARDSSELSHVSILLTKKNLNPVTFWDENPDYGPGLWPTAIAVLASIEQTRGAIDYLPLWRA